MSEDQQTSYIYIVEENNVLNANGKDVTFVGHSIGWMLFENYGSVENLNSLTIQNGAFNNGFQIRNGDGIERGENATLKITEKLTIDSTQHNHNYGMIEADSFEIKGHETYAFENGDSGILKIQSGQIDGYINNYGSIQVGEGKTATFSGLRMQEGSSLTDTNGQSVDVFINHTDGEKNTGSLDIYNTEKDQLTFKNLSTNGGISLRLKENAYLHVLGDVDLYKNKDDTTEIAGSNLYSGLGSTLVVDGKLSVSNLADGSGHIHTNDLLVNGGWLKETGSLTVDGWMTVTTNFTSDAASSFHVKNLRTDNSYTGDRVYVPLYNGHYELENLVLGGGYDDSKKEGAYSGVQLFNSDLTVDNVLVESNTNGMINFYANKEDSSALTAHIGYLEVEESGTLLLNAQENGQNNHLFVDSINIGMNGQIKGKAGSFNMNVTFNSLAGESIIFEKLSENSNVSIGSFDLSGENKINQRISGIKNNNVSSLALTLQEGATVSFNEVNTEFLNIRMNDLQGNDQLTIEDLQNCPGCKNVQVTVNGAANNAPADQIVSQLIDSVNINTLTENGKVNHAYEALVEEGNIYGAIRIGCDGEYSVQENKKLDSIAESTAVSYMQWRYESDDIYKRLGDLRGKNAIHGSWIRTYGGKSKYGDQHIDTEFASVQVGYDRRIDNKYGPVYVGGAFSYTDGDADFDTGDGNLKTYALTAYASFILDNNWFIDATLKYGLLDNDFNINYSGFKYHGEYDTDAVAISAEIGKRFYLSNQIFVEPQLQATYAKVMGENYSTSNGIKVEQDAFDSLIARVGFMTGADFANSKGMAYARASYLYDFEGDLSTEFRDTSGSHTIKQDLSGGWYELDLGVNYDFSQSLSGYTEIEYASGTEIDSPFRWNIGLRYMF